MVSDALARYSQQVGAVFNSLLLHQQGVLVGGENLRQSREILSRDLKGVANERYLVEALFCVKVRKELEKSYKVWKSEINDLPLITNKSNVISELQQTRLVSANREYMSELSRFRLKIANQSIKLVSL